MHLQHLQCLAGSCAGTHTCTDKTFAATSSRSLKVPKTPSLQAIAVGQQTLKRVQILICRHVEAVGTGSAVSKHAQMLAAVSQYKHS